MIVTIATTTTQTERAKQEKQSRVISSGKVVVETRESVQYNTCIYQVKQVRLVRPSSKSLRALLLHVCNRASDQRSWETL
jgi:hypothetical protein